MPGEDAHSRAARLTAAWQQEIRADTANAAVAAWCETLAADPTNRAVLVEIFEFAGSVGKVGTALADAGHIAAAITALEALERVIPGEAVLSVRARLGTAYQCRRYLDGGPEDRLRAVELQRSVLSRLGDDPLGDEVALRLAGALCDAPFGCEEGVPGRAAELASAAELAALGSRLLAAYFVTP